MFNSEFLEEYKKYIKYFVIFLLLIIVLLIIRGCRTSYNELETKVKEATLDYINKNNVNITGETYIELANLKEIEGTEMCSKASGAIVSYENSKIKVEPYLKCENYETKLVNNEGRYVTLNGDAVMILNYGEAFNDPLYVLKTDADVVITGEVKNTPGIYTIHYYVYIDDKLKETLERKVIVTKSDKTLTLSGLKNTENPVLTLVGDQTMTLTVGEKYVDPGYSAYEYEDGKISRNVVVEPTKIDTSKVGSYVINYSVTNSKGRMATAIRNVIVVNRKANLNIILTNETSGISNKANIKIVVTGTGYYYMVLPNNVISYQSTEIYEAKYNGTLTFKIFDTYGNVFTKQIEVNNVDNIPPSGTCKAVVTNASTKIEVNALDNKGISGYTYVLDNERTSVLTENTYEINKSAEKVSVLIKDIANNSSTINCEVEKQKLNSVMISGTCGTSNIYINIKTCFGGKLIRANVPLEEYLMGVIHGENDSNNEEFLKTFIIFARTYTLKRIGYGKNSTYSIRSCSSDQNWCDPDLGCYREQTDEMFNLCIDYAVNYPRPDYTAATCANRVTTYPGSKTVVNKTFYVTNPNWTKEKSVLSKGNTSRWHNGLSESQKQLYTKILQETAGLVLKTSEGKLADVNYYECSKYSNESTLCPTKAGELAKQGYKAEELIAAYSQKYPNAKIECYNS